MSTEFNSPVSSLLISFSKDDRDRFNFLNLMTIQYVGL